MKVILGCLLPEKTYIAGVIELHLKLLICTILLSDQVHVLLYLCSANMKKASILVKPPKKRKGIELEADYSRLASSGHSTSVNLKDWIGSQILAKRDDSLYYPGTIQSVLTDNSIQVSIDSDNSLHVYPNVLETNDILTNCSAPAIMIKIGVPVCVKIKPEDHHFTVGRVRKIKPGPPMQCLVQIDNANQDCVWINRAWIRLLQPPWFDDLEDTGGQEVSLN